MCLHYQQHNHVLQSMNYLRWPSLIALKLVHMWKLDGVKRRFYAAYHAYLWLENDHIRQSQNKTSQTCMDSEMHTKDVVKTSHFIV